MKNLTKNLVAVVRTLVVGFVVAQAVPALAAPMYVEVISNKGEVLVRAGKAEGLKVGSSIQIVGGSIAGTVERHKLGGAIVVEVWDHLAKVSLDEEVERRRGKRWAKLDTSAEDDTANSFVAPSPAKPAKGGALTGAAELDRKFIFKKQVILYNYDKFAWTNCEMRLPNNTIYGPVRVEPGSEYVVMTGKFNLDGAPVDAPVDHVLVTCAEGKADFGFRD